MNSKGDSPSSPWSKCGTHIESCRHLTLGARSFLPRGLWSPGFGIGDPPPLLFQSARRKEKGAREAETLRKRNYPHRFSPIELSGPFLSHGHIFPYL